MRSLDNESTANRTEIFLRKPSHRLFALRTEECNLLRTRAMHEIRNPSDGREDFDQVDMRDLRKREGLVKRRIEITRALDKNSVGRWTFRTLSPLPDSPESRPHRRIGAGGREPYRASGGDRRQVDTGLGTAGSSTTGLRSLRPRTGSQAPALISDSSCDELRAEG